MPFEVILSREARRQLEEIAEWWSVNRRDSPDLFTAEFETALDQLEFAPEAAPHVRVGAQTGLRRLLLRRSAYHLYFEIKEKQAIIEIVAIWHAARGQGPRLG